MSTPFPPKLKLHHRTPGWVPDGETFHVRIRVDRTQSIALTDPALADSLLDSVQIYHERGRWHCSLFLLMPDHIHALLAFPLGTAMSRIIGEWKKYHASQNDLRWQDGYFDHRIRDEHEFELKADYIRKNPVVKSLCGLAGDWPWVVDSQSIEVGRALRARPSSDGTTGLNDH